MSVHAIKNRSELAARMIEAALELDRGKIMADGRRLDQHDIWKVCNKIVGDIRSQLDLTLRVNQQTYYRFEPYKNAGVPGLDIAKMACRSDFGRLSGTNDRDMQAAAEKVITKVGGPAAVVHVYWECWIREQDQWVAAAWETLSVEQREAVRACIDANEFKAAVKTFEAIANCKIHVNDFAAVVEYFNALRTVQVSLPSTWSTPNMQNIPRKKNR